MSEQNEHLKHILDEIEEMEDTISTYLRNNYPSTEKRILSPLFNVSNRLERLEEYVSLLSVSNPQPASGLVKLCVDCRQEEANPGLAVCGPCYSKRIRGHN